MFRLLVALFVVCALVAPAALQAAEVRGTVKSVDTAKNTITVTVDGKDQTLSCAKDCRVTSTTTAGLRGRRTSTQTMTGLSAVGTGSSVTCVTESRAGSETCTEVRLEGSRGGRLAGLGDRFAGLLPRR